MKKKHIISSDSDYFQDKEDVIKLESCPNGGNVCRSQMEFMNSNLLLARKFVENKEYSQALDLIKEAFHSTFDLKEGQCQVCAKFFRDTIINSLEVIVKDITKMGKGIFGFRNYKPDLIMAEKLLEELKQL